MCACKEPNVNGSPGYSHDGKFMGVRPQEPPELEDGDVLIYDLPGRCGRNLDSHCHHFRLVKRHTLHHLLVRNGSGDHAIRITRGIVDACSLIDEESRYWLLQSIDSCVRSEQISARDKETARWYSAACQKRIKLRRKQGVVRAEIIPAT